VERQASSLRPEGDRPVTPWRVWGVKFVAHLSVWSGFYWLWLEAMERMGANWFLGWMAMLPLTRVQYLTGLAWNPWPSQERRQ
jgi:hypothetical protein